MNVLLLGSAPDVLRCRAWPRAPWDRVVAVNNAWRVRRDWDVHVHPEDFPAEARPVPGPGQLLVGYRDFVPAQNAYGGFVYAGGTMAFTAAYWALFALRPRVMALLGCDMVYPAAGPTHFYGTGTPDPLRADVTLRSLEAKSARLRVLAARQGCACVTLGEGETRLAWPRATPDRLPAGPDGWDDAAARAALRREAELGYMVTSGRYWEEAERFDAAEIDALDAMWLRAGYPPGAEER